MLDNWLIAFVFKAVFGIAFWVVLVYPFVYLFHRFFPDGKVKRLLSRRIN